MRLRERTPLRPLSRSGIDPLGNEGRPGEPTDTHNGAVGSHAPKRLDLGVLLADPLALDRHSPILPAVRLPRAAFPRAVSICEEEQAMQSDFISLASGQPSADAPAFCDLTSAGQPHTQKSCRTLNSFGCCAEPLSQRFGGL
jgi:hypothetical protein